MVPRVLITLIIPDFHRDVNPFLVCAVWLTGWARGVIIVVTVWGAVLTMEGRGRGDLLCISSRLNRGIGFTTLSCPI